jgi:hypothetical protein
MGENLAADIAGGGGDDDHRGFSEWAVRGK